MEERSPPLSVEERGGADAARIEPVGLQGRALVRVRGIAEGRGAAR